MSHNGYASNRALQNRFIKADFICIMAHTV